ncbi:MAG TPA: hypothetical protein VFV33_02840 [Gemmatimonadaceae bacterium]|nr:hypothetical protein [Gemmatimonadaceae bacterium]
MSALVRWVREASGLAHAERVRIAARDPWHRFDLVPPLRSFGPGARDFAEYLGGACRVRCTTPAGIGEWLLACHYAEDAHLLDEHDHWLHPSTFELLRAGDCEDFSLWAWRQLLEAGFRAHFVVGVRRLPHATIGRHAWVAYRDDGRDFLLDGVERSLHRMIRPLDEVRDFYEPQVGAGEDGTRFVFAGLYREPWGRQLRLRPGGGRG